MNRFAEFMRARDVLTPTIINEVERMEASKDWKRISDLLFGHNEYDALITDYKRMDKYPFDNTRYAVRGLHVLRAIMADEAAKELGADGYFLKNGIRTIHNYSQGRFKPESVVEDIAICSENVPKNQNNTVTILDATFNASKAAISEMFDVVIEHSPYQTTLKGKALKLFNENTFLQKLRNEWDDNDNQKNLHIDTFFPCLKFWYFPEEVKANYGAFSYAQGSAELTTKKLEWIYRESVKITTNCYESWRLKDHMEGSLRASNEDMQEMGLESKQIGVPADTLVIANVCGLHGRGDTMKRVWRYGIHGSIRINPMEGLR